MKKTIIFAFALMVTACTPSHRGPDEVVIIMQVCVPDTEFGQTAIGISSVSNAIVSGMEPVSALTTAKQSVFMSNGDRPSSQLGFIVRKPTGKQYVFRPPSIVSFERWTDWISAERRVVSRDITNGGPSYKLLRGIPIEDETAPSPLDPKARFRRMTFLEYLNGISASREQGRPEDLPPC